MISFSYCSVELKCCELVGIVATDEDYRGSRLGRIEIKSVGMSDALTNLFFDTIKTENYDLVVIEGIPYFYRKYGFYYSIDMISEN